MISAVTKSKIDLCIYIIYIMQHLKTLMTIEVNWPKFYSKLNPLYFWIAANDLKSSAKPLRLLNNFKDNHLICKE